MEVAEIYTEFQKSLLAYIRSKIRSKEDAEDILQNIFIKIAGSVNQLSDQEKLRNWVFAITRNAIIDYYQANANKKNSMLDEGHLENTIDEENEDTTKGLDRCIHSMINQLPNEYKEIIVEVELKGAKQKDLSVKYQMPYSSMKSRVQRGRERLKQLFYNCCHIETDRLGNVLEAHARKSSSCETPCKPTED